MNSENSKQIDTMKIMEQKHQETMPMVVSETQKLQAQFDLFKRNHENNTSLDREFTILGMDNSSLPQTVELQDHIAKQYMSDELQTYLKESCEDENVLNNAEWLIKQFNDNVEVLSMDALSPILEIINPRATIISAIHNYQQQSKTWEGSEKWEAT